MLECRKYEYQELKEYLGCSSPQGIIRKLTKYEVDFTHTGRGQASEYQIEAIHNPFKVFAVFDMGISPQTDFRKFAYYLYQLMNDDAFAGMGMEMMEEYLRETACPVSRQTISKYLRHLERNEFVCLDVCEYVYYRVYKRFGVQTHDIVSKEEYSNAWKVYWDCLNRGYNTYSAFTSMYNYFHGAPRKQSKVMFNAFYNETLDWILELLLKDFGDQN